MADENGQVETSTTAPNATVVTDQGSNSNDANWVAGLQFEDNRTLVEAKQWKTISWEIQKIRRDFGPEENKELGPRRTKFAEAPDHDLTDIAQAMIASAATATPAPASIAPPFPCVHSAA